VDNVGLINHTLPLQSTPQTNLTMSSTRILRSKNLPLGPAPSKIPQPLERKKALPSSELETSGVLDDVEHPRPPSPPAEEEETARPLPVKEVTETVPVMATRSSTDVEDNEDDSEDEDAPRAKHGRARSVDSAQYSIRNKKTIYFKSHTLSTEQEQTVNAAAEALTQAQKERLERRQENVTTRVEENNEPGTSLSKGKAIDPGNWGNSGIDPEELDPETQAALIDAYKNKRIQIVSKKDDPKDSTKVLPVSGPRDNGNPRQSGNLRANSRPATQIVPDSSLGVALGNVAMRHGHPDDSDDSDDSSSDYDDGRSSTSTRSYSSTRS
jgi:hypothetical protein